VKIGSQAHRRVLDATPVAIAEHGLVPSVQPTAFLADTWEVGIKSQVLDRRVNLGLSLFDTVSHNGYFFVFLPANKPGLPGICTTSLD